ncbi:prenyltransferase family protein [Actinidia rufa]|uniref:Prenyltransferase family protein n=1 Tax=Actinidia rufa TaxID=165716 RepID=A0A7J0FBK2_9ERIC|nr:prenyltransferase family protein [Actinidia rufa]
MHDGGEIDVRACYTAISVASILNVLDYELVQNVGNYILSCQTYEGGIAGEPCSEAHGGIGWYLDKDWRVDFRGEQINWLMAATLFWQGGVSALIQRLHSIVDEQLLPSEAGEEDRSTDSTRISAASDFCEGEEGLEEDLSRVDEACHFRRAVKIAGSRSYVVSLCISGTTEPSLLASLKWGKKLEPF